VKRTAVIDHEGKVLPGAAEALGQENDVQIAKLSWLSRRDAAKLNWLTSGDARPAGMTSVKISHHGSRSSTPLDFWDEVKPKNVVISLPSRMHIHPCE
jgi:hypothetical protein